MIAPRTLTLVANPWAAIDAEGRPCGACRRDPVEDNPDLGFVGAVLEARLIKAQSSRRVGKREQIVEHARHDRTFRFDPNPVRVPNTAYYRDRAAKLPYELFPGDAKTAQYLGYKDFVSAERLIAESKAKAIKTFDAENGEGAWQEFEDERAEADKATKQAVADEVAKASASTEAAKQSVPAKSGK